jgi:hypothetical protein
MKRPRLHHVSAALDGDVLLVIDLVNYRRCVSTKTGLELPQHLAGLGVDRYKVAVGFATKQETPGRHSRTAVTAQRYGNLCCHTILFVVLSIAVKVPPKGEPIGGAWVPFV